MANRLLRLFPRNLTCSAIVPRVGKKPGKPEVGNVVQDWCSRKLSRNTTNIRRAHVREVNVISRKSKRSKWRQDAIAAEFAYLHQEVDPNRCSCRNHRCCEET